MIQSHLIRLLEIRKIFIYMYCLCIFATSNHRFHYLWPKTSLDVRVFSKFKLLLLVCNHAEPPGLCTNKRTFLRRRASCTVPTKSCCTEALYLNPNTILHSDSESSCQEIEDLFACNCLILPFLQAPRELQPTNRQPNLAY